MVNYTRNITFSLSNLAIGFLAVIVFFSVISQSQSGGINADYLYKLVIGVGLLGICIFLIPPLGFLLSGGILIYLIFVKATPVLNFVHKNLG